MYRASFRLWPGLSVSGAPLKLHRAKTSEDLFGHPVSQDRTRCLGFKFNGYRSWMDQSKPELSATEYNKFVSHSLGFRATSVDNGFTQACVCSSRSVVLTVTWKYCFVTSIVLAECMMGFIWYHVLS